MVGGTISSIVGNITSGATVTSTQAGNITMSTANRVVWGEGNASEDINNWSPNELQNFVKWFIEVHHPEAVKQYQAIRAIERKAEEAEKLEYEAQQAEYMKQFWANQARGAQNAYQYPTYTTSAIQQTAPKKSFLRKLGDWIDGV